MAISAWFVLAWVAAEAVGDTLVVCPAGFRTELAPWESYRRAQGHVLEVIQPPRTAAELQRMVRAAARDRDHRSVVLIGDVDVVPTCYAEAKVNIFWGSEPTIATDQLYGDLDGDQVPDVAIGRIPADSSAELAAVVRKVLRYERSIGGESARRRQIDVVAGVGGFGVVADTLIEASARSVFQQVVPKQYDVRRLKADPDMTGRQISASSLAWIYLGHGLPTMLDVAATPSGARPILTVNDVANLRCEPDGPLAVLVACYTGAIDAGSDSLAEELVLAERGPVAAIAATRVTMPYGNSVLGCELLRSAFCDSPGTLGDIWLRAQRASMNTATADDKLRASLDAVARGVSPPAVDLAEERREHVLLYQLLGDPLLRLRLPAAVPKSPTRLATEVDGSKLVK